MRGLFTATGGGVSARYSAEFTIYRELLQNSNDANATAVEVVFEECDGSQDDPHPPITNITIRNNGRPFSREDWSRLRRIAEGNPDEQKAPCGRAANL